MRDQPPQRPPQPDDRVEGRGSAWSGILTLIYGEVIRILSWVRPSAWVDSRGVLWASSTRSGHVVTVLPQDAWAVVHNPGANAQATVSRAAVAASRHVCTSIILTLATSALPAAVQLTWALRDGTTGAGTVLLQGAISIPATAGTMAPPIMLSGLHVPGSINTAMTLEFSGAAGLSTVEVVAMAGYDTLEGT